MSDPIMKGSSDDWNKMDPKFRTRLLSEMTRLKAEVERLTDENARLTMMKDACKRMIKRRDKWISEQKAEVERLKGCQMIEATYVVSPEDAERIRRRLERKKGGQS